jgi:hydrogenase maturation protease
MRARQASIRTQRDKRVLVLGWGNPGRVDDGLGPCLAGRLASLGLEGVTVETAYQLQIEHADRVAEFDLVVFVDAAASGPSPFLARPLGPMGRPAFSTHALEPGTVLALAKELYGAEPRAILLGVRGYEFDGFGERLSPRAERNLESARTWLAEALAPPQPAASGPSEMTAAGGNGTRTKPPQKVGSEPARRN